MFSSFIFAFMCKYLKIMWNLKRLKWKWKEVEDWTKRGDSKAHGRAKIVYINGLASFTLASHTNKSHFFFSLSTIPLFFPHSNTIDTHTQNKTRVCTIFIHSFSLFFIHISYLNYYLPLTDPFGFSKLFSLISSVFSVSF